MLKIWIFILGYALGVLTLLCCNYNYNYNKDKTISSVELSFSETIAPINGNSITIIGFFPEGFAIKFSSSIIPSHNKPIWVNGIGYPGIMVKNGIETELDSVNPLNIIPRQND